MSDRRQLKPGPNHPITIEPLQKEVVVRVGDKLIARSVGALVLREANYPPVIYIPRGDADMTLLERTAHSTYCPYKGDASYFNIPGGGDRSRNAVWTYETPYVSVAAIKD